MMQKQQDIWTVPGAQAICVTTNGTLTKDGRGVMGRGVALQARQRFKHADYSLGHFIKTHGNCVGVFIEEMSLLSEKAIVAFPVKHEWFERADLELIKTSARQLVALADERGWRRVVLPRPGCGNGQRTWAEVEPLLKKVLNERFLVVWQ